MAISRKRKELLNFNWFNSGEFAQIAKCRGIRVFVLFLGLKYSSVLFLRFFYLCAWVTRAEHPKGAKDEVKPARRASK